MRRRLCDMSVHVPGAELGLVVAGPERSRVQELAPSHWRATRGLRVVVVIGEGQEMRVGERRAHGFVVLIHAEASRRLAAARWLLSKAI